MALYYEMGIEYVTQAVRAWNHADNFEGRQILCVELLSNAFRNMFLHTIEMCGVPVYTHKTTKTLYNQYKQLVPELDERTDDMLNELFNRTSNLYHVCNPIDFYELHQCFVNMFANYPLYKADMSVLTKLNKLLEGMGVNLTQRQLQRAIPEVPWEADEGYLHGEIAKNRANILTVDCNMDIPPDVSYRNIRYTYEEIEKGLDRVHPCKQRLVSLLQRSARKWDIEARVYGNCLTPGCTSMNKILVLTEQEIPMHKRFRDEFVFVYMKKIKVGSPQWIAAFNGLKIHG